MSNEFPLFHGFDQAVVRLGAYHLSIRVGKWQFGSPCVGLNGIIYCTPTGDSFGQVLKAYSPDGSELWQYAFDAYIFRPVVSSDGTVYVAASQGQSQESTLTLFALSDAGKVLWSRSWPMRRSGSFPICDAYGFVYLILNNELNKIGPDGSVLWTVLAPGHEPALLGIWENQVYVLVSEGWQSSIRTFTPEGQQLWDLKAPFDAPEIQRTVRQRLVEKHGQERADQTHVHIMYVPSDFDNRAVFTPLGNLIISNPDDYLYSISPSGRTNWRFNPEKADCIGAANGTAAVYVTWKWGVYAVTENGELLWKRQQRYTTVPVVGKQKEVYIAGMHEASAFDTDGNLLWVEPIQGIPGLYPVLTHLGQFCVTTDQGYMHLFG